MSILASNPKKLFSLSLNNTLLVLIPFTIFYYRTCPTSDLFTESKLKTPVFDIAVTFIKYNRIVLFIINLFKFFKLVTRIEHFMNLRATSIEITSEIERVSAANE